MLISKSKRLWVHFTKRIRRRRIRPRPLTRPSRLFVNVSSWLRKPIKLSRSTLKSTIRLLLRRKLIMTLWIEQRNWILLTFWGKTTWLTQRLLKLCRMFTTSSSLCSRTRSMLVLSVMLSRKWAIWSLRLPLNLMRTIVRSYKIVLIKCLAATSCLLNLTRLVSIRISLKICLILITQASMKLVLVGNNYSSTILIMSTNRWMHLLKDLRHTRKPRKSCHKIKAIRITRWL